MSALWFGLVGCALAFLSAMPLGFFACFAWNLGKDRAHKVRPYFAYGFFFYLLYWYLHIPFCGRYLSFDTIDLHSMFFWLRGAAAFIIGCILRRMHVLCVYGFRGKKVPVWFILSGLIGAFYFVRSLFL